MENQEKLSVLFVDDETAVLKVLVRLLADMRGEWRMETAESGDAALRLMAQIPFDVIVSDLRMPGIGGNELLRKVQELYPLCSRIVYSGYGDQKTILSCVGLVHQFLPKPCPTEWLRSAIQRTAIIRAYVPDRAMRERVATMERFLSMPGLYLQLVRQIQSVETPIEEIAATVSQDVGMTAEVLRIVNSAFFGLAQPTSSVMDAIGYLGIETVKHLVLAVGIFSQFQEKALGGILLANLWHHSVRTSHAARLIAKTDSAKREVVEDALAAGLLHDVGKLVLACQDPERYEQMIQAAMEKETEWHVAERRAFGVDHADLGGYILGLWGLPLGVVEAVAHHHCPARSQQTSFGALAAVHAANVLVQMDKRTVGGIPTPQVDLAFLAKVGRANAFDDWRGQLEEAEPV